MWTQIVGSSKPIVERTILCRGEKILRPGLMDTGGDVTIIARSEWTSYWEVQPVAGRILGIGGVAITMRNKHNIIVELPEGEIATIRPYIVRAPITLWGRDLLSQWGASIRISNKDF